MKPKVLLTTPLPNEWIAQLDGKVDLIVNMERNSEWISSSTGSPPRVDGVLSMLTDRIDEEFLTQKKELRVVSNMAAGFDNIDIDACTKRGIPVGNTPGVMTEATADITIALILASARRIVESAMDAREGRWHVWAPTGWLGRDLFGSTLGIIGLGKIGSAVAKRAISFGMKIIYWEPRHNVAKGKDVDAEYVALDELLSGGDIITLHCPLNNSTLGLINRSALRKMKSGAILINTSRGPVVDTNALVVALSEKWISAAGLDVTDPEPLLPNHPLYQLNNCVILPHIGSATFGTRRRMAEIACGNLLAGLEGRRLPYCVNPIVYGEN